MERSGTWGAIYLDFACHSVLETAAEDEQARVLACVERIRLARAWSPTEEIWLVMVARTIAVTRSEVLTWLLLLQKGHVRRDTPCRYPVGLRAGSESKLRLLAGVAHVHSRARSMR